MRSYSIRQLFVMQSRELAKKVSAYFARLVDSLTTASSSPEELSEISARKKSGDVDEKVRLDDKEKKEEVAVDPDDEVDYQTDLPERFSLLEETHFPFFIPFDQVKA